MIQEVDKQESDTILDHYHYTRISPNVFQSSTIDHAMGNPRTAISECVQSKSETSDGGPLHSTFSAYNQSKGLVLEIHYSHPSVRRWDLIH